MGRSASKSASLHCIDKTISFGITDIRTSSGFASPKIFLLPQKTYGSGCLLLPPLPPLRPFAAARVLRFQPVNRQPRRQRAELPVRLPPLTTVSICEPLRTTSCDIRCHSGDRINSPLHRNVFPPACCHSFFKLLLGFQPFRRISKRVIPPVGSAPKEESQGSVLLWLDGNV